LADGMGKLAVADDRPAAPPVPAGKPVAQGPAHQPQEAPPLSRKRIVPPPRPGLGTSGRKLAVRANHFFVEVSVNDIFHYDVSSTHTHSFLNLVLRLQRPISLG
jgi:eukaryotic translation initiation factor 2C